jgi:dipeptidyl aminopeptidase/acylaminoacyl peptidase
MTHPGLRPRLVLAVIGAISALAIGAPCSARTGAFGIEDVLQAPYPSSLTTASNSRAAAWVFEVKGVRNAWIADPASHLTARQVTTFAGDDGFDIGDLALSADGHWIAFSRGQTLEDQMPANVASSPAGPIGREVWMAPTSDGQARKVGDGHSAIFSPDGTKLAFVNGGQLFVAEVSAAAKAEAVVVDMGGVASPTWSPDGKRLAFVSRRNRHAIVGLYDFAAKTIVWASPSLDHDANPIFSPDGAQLAFIRVPQEKSLDFVTRRTAQPWSIWVADTATGRGRRVWTADPGQGSAYHPTLSDRNLLWTAHDQLVFPWEKTGWLQLYAVPAAGGVARALTAGAFEVGYFAGSPDRASVVLASSQDDEDRMHVWRVNPDRGGAIRVGDGHAIEVSPHIAADGTLFALQSDATRPLLPVVFEGNRWRMLAAGTVPASFPTAALVAPQSLTFKAKDGQLVHAQIFLPRDGRAGTRPAILFFHGGPQRQMLLGFHPMDAYNWMYSENQSLVAQGYIVLSVNYRGGIGYGLDYREAKDFGPDGGSELNDLLGAITYLQSRKDVDPRRLGIWGASYGGLMTALGLARASDALAAGVDYAGLYNWSTFLASVGVPLDGSEANQKAIESSPVATIGKWRSPVLVVQADDDRNVPLQQSSDLIEDLRSHGVPHEEIMIPNEVHDLTRYASWLRLFNATNVYFEGHLKNAVAAEAK